MNKNNEYIKNYFNEDIKKAVRDMSYETMKRELIAFEGSPAWFAMLKYVQDRISVIQDSFLMLDPVKEPSRISQYQGVITGMLDLQDAVLNLKYESLKKETKEDKKERNDSEAYGSYGSY